MSKLKHSILAKIIAAILFAVFLTAAILSALGIAFLVDNDLFYRENLSFFDSELCEREVNSFAYRIYSEYNSYKEISSHTLLSFAEATNNRYNSENCNIAFTVQDSDGNILLSNFDEPNYGFKHDYKYEIYNDYYRLNTESYIVTCSVRKNMTAFDGIYQVKAIFDTFTSIGGVLLIVIASLSGALSFLLFVFLMCAAGYRKGVEGVTLNSLDKIPFDIYTAAAVCIVTIGLSVNLDRNTGLNFLFLFIPIMFICSLVFIVYCLSFAARYKAKTLLKNTVTYRVCKLIFKLLKMLAKVLLTIFRNMSVLKKFLLIFGGITVFESFILVMTANIRGDIGYLILWLIEKVVLCGLLCYFTLHLNKLKDGGERIANGDFSYKIDTQRMLWDFKKHGENLNSISDGISKAVEERLKSERLKTELITNVSHDIKTPLTSIINYVDLLKKEKIESENAREYLDVLDRQSARLKKMTEDLVEASKASSGSINVSPARTDIKELLSQAVGEYDERLKACFLDPMITLPEHELPVFCDGRLLWRVFDNLLSNICKYSLPTSRVYFSAVEKDGKVEITFKNISKYPLNISSDELTERFVRGDSSRSTEGSGLGLSIAKSLTELQKGKFELFIDGDLFKAVITFDKI